MPSLGAKYNICRTPWWQADLGSGHGYQAQMWPGPEAHLPPAGSTGVSRSDQVCECLGLNILRRFCRRLFSPFLPPYQLSAWAPTLRSTFTQSLRPSTNQGASRLNLDSHIIPFFLLPSPSPTPYLSSLFPTLEPALDILIVPLFGWGLGQIIINTRLSTCYLRASCFTATKVCPPR